MNNWNNAYSAHRRPITISPLREWVMAFSIGALIAGALITAFVR
jgi:hypothetical protein